MEEKQKVLDLFDSDEIKSLISELIDATDAISKKQPIIGFHHKFYVPGWVGLFQLMAVESKMSKFEQQPFYKDMNYLAFADWIISSSEKLANLQNAPNVEGAKKFLDFFITEEAQNVIPLTQWMFPANKNVKLPESYDVAF